jgi:hypothetical protein
MTKLSPFLKFCVIVLICMMAFACSKLTQSNFEKIKLGMTIKQVTAILGEPTNVESINIAGISGTSATWKDEDGQIDIQFLNERVTVKAFSAYHTAKPSNEDDNPETI